MSNSLHKTATLVMKFQKKILKFRDEILEREIKKFNDIYMEKQNRYPNEIEVKNYKKRLVMFYGSTIYIGIFLVILFIMTMSKGA